MLKKKFKKLPIGWEPWEVRVEPWDVEEGADEAEVGDLAVDGVKYNLYCTPCWQLRCYSCGVLADLMRRMFGVLVVPFFQTVLCNRQ
jgi:hypothetical protein